MSDARAEYLALDVPWRVALAEAWESWRAGCAGVGAVISDSAGTIVAVGRNRIISERIEPGVLASTAIAHAEMNAMAVLPLGPTAELTISTTFEPCLMCAATIFQARIPRVRYAAADPVVHEVHDGLATLPFARERVPVRTELGGPIGAFAHVLHVSWMTFWVADEPVMDAHRRLRPDHLALAEQVAHGDELAAVSRGGGDVVDALEALWPMLVGLADGD